MTRSNLPMWDDIATEMDRYEVGGGCKSDPRTETVWSVLGHEVRIRVRRRTRNGRTWQYYVNANCRGGHRGMGQTNILDDPDFRQFLDVRCPSADDDLLDLLRASVAAATQIEVDVSREQFLPVRLYEGDVWLHRGDRAYS